MGKRYYCEYCDKAFADNATNRRNHLKGLNHQKMRQLHYSAYKSAAAILEEEASKKPCRRFFQTGNCDYGDRCRFTHMLPERKKQLEEQVLRDDCRKAKQSGQEEPTLDSWLVKKRKTTSDKERETIPLPNFEMCPALVGIPNLPPSLLPPSQEDLLEGVTLEWG